MILVSVFAFSVAASAAQSKKNQYAKANVKEFEGTLNFGYSTTSVSGVSADVLALSMNPAMHYFLSDGFHLGLGLPIGYSSVSASGTSVTTTSLGVQGIGGYTIEVSPDLFLDLRALVGYGSLSGSSITTTSGINFGAGPILKFDTGNGLLNAGIITSYALNSTGGVSSKTLSTVFSVGYSIYY